MVTPANQNTSSYQKETLAVWEKFIAGEPLGKHSVPPYIINGWKLSRESGIDPYTGKAPPVLTPKELDKLRNKNRLLLRAAEPMLNMLAVSIHDTGYIATFAAPSGYLLEVVGDENLMEQARDQYNIPGADRSIKAVGASALTLAITEKRPVMVQGAEHYNKYWHDWRCAAAPVFDSDNNPIASLTISSHISLRDTHTLTLAKSCAAGISIRMREIMLLESEQRLNAMLESVHNALPELVLAVDHEGAVTHANNSAMSYLGLSPRSMNRNLREFIAPPDYARVQRFLKDGESATLEVEILSLQGPQNHVCRFSPISVKGSGSRGMTVSISKRRELLDLTRHVSGNYAKYSFEDLKGENRKLREQIDLARRAAASNHRILLTGESGTGKELFAQSIHNASSSHAGPFVALSCAAIPRDLIESELFGYVGGAFTGARRNGMIGKMELATGGTLFLDEVNSLPLEMQAKLLRALQQMEVVRIGDTKPTPVNARIIAATNRDLREEVRIGHFREDLYFRLHVLEIVIPPLRERRDDISLLAHAFLRRQSYETGRPFHQITGNALGALYSYDWPGNIRELDNVCERALLLSEDGVIDVCHLPRQVVGAAKIEQPGESMTSVSTSIHDTMKELIVRTLERHNGNISKVAGQLGVARSTLYRRMRHYGIEG